MSTALERLFSKDGAQPLTGESIDGFIAGPGQRLVVFTGDPKQRPEAQDVAVVARELRRERPELSIGVVGSAEETAVRPRFNIDTVPSVLFIKNGRVVSTVSKVQDWVVYARTAALVFGRSLKEATS